MSAARRVTRSSTSPSAASSTAASSTDSIPRKSTRRSIPTPETSTPPTVLSSAYLSRHSNKSDLVRRLRKIVHALSDEDVEAHSPSYPGLDGLASTLVLDSYLGHKDKEVRLHTVLACMELFYLYAPEPPWDETEILAIFSQTIRQISNLSHCTSPSQPNFSHYFRLLEQLSVVKIGVVLVELTSQNSPNALETLTSLTEAILCSCRNEHPPEVTQHAVGAITACIEEFDHAVPVPILDEILLCLAAGPTLLVTNPEFVKASAKKHRKKPLPSKQIPKANPSYIVSASILRRTEDRISTPVASLLNSLLESSSETSRIEAGEVSPIIFELHRVAPSVLTTVIGTISHALQETEVSRRHDAVRLLGKLFASPNSAVGINFAGVYREWCGRIHDVDSGIRTSMVFYLISILRCTPAEAMEIPAEAGLEELLADPEVDVRMAVIHSVCDWVFESEKTPAGLLKGLGTRVGSKHPRERKDAVTGLARIYHKRFIAAKLGASDDPHDILSREDEDLEKFAFIPRVVFESACITDAADSEMRNRVVQILDDVLLGNANAEDAESRALGMVFVSESLSDNSELWFGMLLDQRARLQKALSAFIDAHSALQKCEDTESVEYMNLQLDSCDKLKRVAGLTAPVPENLEKEILEKIHNAKDKHIFRLLATIATPLHTPAARKRALDELPKRTASLGAAESTFIKVLARRCAMGGSVNLSVMRKSLELALAQLEEGDVVDCGRLIRIAVFCSKAFPEMIREEFDTLGQLLVACRGLKGKLAKEVLDEDLVSILVGVLASCERSDPPQGSFDELESQLRTLCTKDGTPVQSRHAVRILCCLSRDDPKKEKLLLKALTNSTSLSTENERIVSVLDSLSGLIDFVPEVLSSKNVDRVVEFAMSQVVEEDDDEIMDSSPIKEKPNSRRRKSADHDDVSLSTRRICACIDFLISYISTSLQHNPSSTKLSDPFFSSLFSRLVSILQNNGRPPNSPPLTSQDLASLRSHSSTALLRLADSSLNLSARFSVSTWHVLASSFLDRNKSVRTTAFRQLQQLLQPPPKKKPIAPNLRFLAYTVFCVDFHELNGTPVAGAPVGRLSQTVKTSLTRCIVDLRKTCDMTLHKCRALGSSAEKKFDRTYKPRLMPEFSLLYALHLLSFRRETDEKGASPEEYRLLLKRVKWLVEPLVGSLGDEADNISFLLRMVEVVGNGYRPIPPDSEETYSDLSQSLREKNKDDASLPTVKEVEDVASIKLKIVCRAAREVLLGFVKKDVNLMGYAGNFPIPSGLFRKVERNGVEDLIVTVKKSRRKSSRSTGREKKKKEDVGVTSSPLPDNGNSSLGDEEENFGSPVSTPLEDPTDFASPMEDSAWGDISPIAKDSPIKQANDLRRVKARLESGDNDKEPKAEDNDATEAMDSLLVDKFDDDLQKDKSQEKKTESRRERRSSRKDESSMRLTQTDKDSKRRKSSEKEKPPRKDESLTRGTKSDRDKKRRKSSEREKDRRDKKDHEKKQSSKPTAKEGTDGPSPSAEPQKKSLAKNTRTRRSSKADPERDNGKDSITTIKVSEKSSKSSPKETPDISPPEKEPATKPSTKNSKKRKSSEQQPQADTTDIEPQDDTDDTPLSPHTPTPSREDTSKSLSKRSKLSGNSKVSEPAPSEEKNDTPKRKAAARPVKIKMGIMIKAKPVPQARKPQARKQKKKVSKKKINDFDEFDFNEEEEEYSGTIWKPKGSSSTLEDEIVSTWDEKNDGGKDTKRNSGKSSRTAKKNGDSEGGSKSKSSLDKKRRKSTPTPENTPVSDDEEVIRDQTQKNPRRKAKAPSISTPSDDVKKKNKAPTSQDTGRSKRSASREKKAKVKVANGKSNGKNSTKKKADIELSTPDDDKTPLSKETKSTASKGKQSKTRATTPTRTKQGQIRSGNKRGSDTTPSTNEKNDRDKRTKSRTKRKSLTPLSNDGEGEKVGSPDDDPELLQNDGKETGASSDGILKTVKLAKHVKKGKQARNKAKTSTSRTSTTKSGRKPVKVARTAKQTLLTPFLSPPKSSSASKKSSKRLKKASRVQAEAGSSDDASDSRNVTTKSKQKPVKAAISVSSSRLSVSSNTSSRRSTRATRAQEEVTSNKESPVSKPTTTKSKRKPIKVARSAKRTLRTPSLSSSRSSVASNLSRTRSAQSLKRSGRRQS